MRELDGPNPFAEDSEPPALKAEAPVETGFRIPVDVVSAVGVVRPQLRQRHGGLRPGEELWRTIGRGAAPALAVAPWERHRQ